MRKITLSFLGLVFMTSPSMATQVCGFTATGGMRCITLPDTPAEIWRKKEEARRRAALRKRSSCCCNTSQPAKSAKPTKPFKPKVKKTLATPAKAVLRNVDAFSGKLPAGVLPKQAPKIYRLEGRDLETARRLKREGAVRDVAARKHYHRKMKRRSRNVKLAALAAAGGFVAWKTYKHFKDQDPKVADKLPKPRQKAKSPAEAHQEAVQQALAKASQGRMQLKPANGPPANYSWQRDYLEVAE